MALPELAAATLLAATALHAGFQLTVTVLVYPALAGTTAAEWAAAHDRHSRRITPVVALCYGALVLSGAWVLVVSQRDPATLLAVAAGVGCLAITALVAAPAHGRLGREGPRPEVLARLLRWDRGRLALALLACVASAAALLRA